jgi:hypothetical protein
MMELRVSKEAFTDMLRGIVMSGVTFTAIESGDDILITFKGGF